MAPEDRRHVRLDTLLSQGQRERKAGSPRSLGSRAPADDELRPLLAVADRLTPLAKTMPQPAFRRDTGAKVISRAKRQRALRITLRLAPAAAAAVLALTLGVYTAAAQVGPDNPLYSVHRTVENVQAQLPGQSQQDRVGLHLQDAYEALSQLDAAARNHDNAAYNTALSSLLSEVSDANKTLSTIPAGSNYDALSAQVSALQARMRQDLAANLRSINWPNRLSTTTALGGLGVAVPQVSAAQIVRLGGAGNGGNGGGHGSSPPIEQVTVSGSGLGFEPGEAPALVIDSHIVDRAAKITMTSPTQLTAQLADENIEHAHSIGISYPDGYAAQTMNITTQDGQDNGGDGGGEHPTVTPSTTKTPDGQEGDGH
jgi:hypothetical protein